MSAAVSSPTAKRDDQASTQEPQESHAAVVQRYTKGVSLDHRYRRALAMARRDQLELGRQHRRMQAMSARGPKPQDASAAVGPVLDVSRARMHIPTKETRQNRNPAYEPPTGSLVGEPSPGKRALEDRLLMLQDARNMDEGVLLVEQLTRARMLAAASGELQARQTPRTWAAFAIDPAATPATLAVGAGLDFEDGQSSNFTGERTFYTSVPGVVSHTVLAPVLVDPAGSEEWTEAEGAEVEPGSPIAPYLTAARAAEEEARQVSRAVEQETVPHAPQGRSPALHVYHDTAAEEARHVSRAVEHQSVPQGWSPALHVYNDTEAPAAWASAWETSAASPMPESMASRAPTWYATDPVPWPEEESIPEGDQPGFAQRGMTGQRGSPPSRLVAVVARPGSAAARPGSAAARPGSAVSQSSSAAARPGSAASRPPSATASAARPPCASRPASAASRPTSASTSASRPSSASSRPVSATSRPTSAAARPVFTASCSASATSRLSSASASRPGSAAAVHIPAGARVSLADRGPGKATPRLHGSLDNAML
jgi:hypothetical protein